MLQKSQTTTWDGAKTLANNGNIHEATNLKWLAGFLPSTEFLGGGNSNIFYVHPENWGRWTHFDSYFSSGLVQPPTSSAFKGFLKYQPYILGVQRFPRILTDAQMSHNGLVETTNGDTHPSKTTPRPKASDVGVTLCAGAVEQGDPRVKPINGAGQKPGDLGIRIWMKLWILRYWILYVYQLQYWISLMFHILTRWSYLADLLFCVKRSAIYFRISRIAWTDGSIHHPPAFLRFFSPKQNHEKRETCFRTSLDLEWL